MKGTGYIKKLIFTITAFAVTVFFLSSCRKFPIGPQPVDAAKNDTIIRNNGVFIVCEGNYNWGNGSVCHYDFNTKHISLNLFQKINSRPLGDIPQSMNINNNKAYIIVNNSNRVEIVDMPSFRSSGMIAGINSPRYMLFISDTKAYVSSLYGNVIYIVNPGTMTISGTIKTGVSTEKLLWVNNMVYVANWSKGNKILVINPSDDSVVRTIGTGKEPNSMVLDLHQKLWVLCSGGFMHDEKATLFLINPVNTEILKTFTFPAGAYPTKLCMNQAKDTLFFLNSGIYKMSVNDPGLPSQAFILQKNRNFYGLAADPASPQLFVSNSGDYVQAGWVLRFSNSGTVLDSCKTDVNPGEFYFN